MEKKPSTDASLAAQTRGPASRSIKTDTIMNSSMIMERWFGLDQSADVIAREVRSSARPRTRGDPEGLARPTSVTERDPRLAGVDGRRWAKTIKGSEELERIDLHEVWIAKALQRFEAVPNRTEAHPVSPVRFQIESMANATRM